MTKPAKLKLTIYQGATFRKRLRWEQRELERELRERAQQQAEPRRDDGPLPRIDCMRTAEKRPATVR